MAMILVKMSIQNIEFQKYSQSIIVIASMYAATAFLKHSKKHESSETNKFCSELRRLIFELLNSELAEQNVFTEQKDFITILKKSMSTA
jgi:hypothetical protein